MILKSVHTNLNDVKSVLDKRIDVVEKDDVIFLFGKKDNMIFIVSNNINDIWDIFPRENESDIIGYEGVYDDDDNDVNDNVVVGLPNLKKED